MDPGWAKVAVDLAQFGILGAIGIYQWVVSKDRVRRDQIATLEDEIARIGHDHDLQLARLESHIDANPTGKECTMQSARISRLEEQIKHMPGTREIKALYDRLNPLAESMSALRAQATAHGEALQDIKRGLSVLNESLIRREEGRHL